MSFVGGVCVFSAGALRIRGPINTEMKQQCAKMKSKATNNVQQWSPNRQQDADMEAKTTQGLRVAAPFGGAIGSFGVYIFLCIRNDPSFDHPLEHHNSTGA